MAQYIDERGDVVSSEETRKRETLTPREARQGMLGRPVLYVLVIGLVLAFIAWGGAGIWGESTDRDAPATPPATSQTDNAVPNQPSGTSTFDDNQATGNGTVTQPATPATPAAPQAPASQSAPAAPAEPAPPAEQTAPVDQDPTPPSSTGGASQQVTPDGPVQ